MSSIAQAAAVSAIKDSSNVNELIAKYKQCKAPNKCEEIVIAKYATLTVSIVSISFFQFSWLRDCHQIFAILAALFVRITLMVCQNQK